MPISSGNMPIPGVDIAVGWDVDDDSDMDNDGNVDVDDGVEKVFVSLAPNSPPLATILSPKASSYEPSPQLQQLRR